MIICLYQQRKHYKKVRGQKRQTHASSAPSDGNNNTSSNEVEAITSTDWSELRRKSISSLPTYSEAGFKVRGEFLCLPTLNYYLFWIGSRHFPQIYIPILGTRGRTGLNGARNAAGTSNECNFIQKLPSDAGSASISDIEDEPFIANPVASTNVGAQKASPSAKEFAGKGPEREVGLPMEMSPPPTAPVINAEDDDTSEDDTGEVVNAVAANARGMYYNYRSIPDQYIDPSLR